MKQRIKIGREEDGITLIALVVTIVLLIILAAVSINVLIGENGIIRRAREMQEMQARAEEKERLELVIPEVITDKLDGKITLEDYIQKLKEKGMIEGEILDNEDNSKEIITDRGYVAKIEDKGEGKIEITIIGKVDDLPPRIVKIHTEATTNRIEIRVEARRVEKATYTYFYKEEGAKEYTQVKKTKENTCVLQDMKQNTRYTVKVEVTNKKGTTQEEVVVCTGEIPIEAIHIGDIQWNENTHKATVAITKTEENEYILQYSDSPEGPWITLQSGERTEEKEWNTIIYARLYDGVNASAYTTLKVTDDTLPKKANIILSKTNGTVLDTISVQVEQIDKESGVVIDKCKWIYSMDENEIGTEEALYTGGTFSSNPQTLALKAPIGGNYYLHVLTIDKAGNKIETISEKIEIANTVLIHFDANGGNGGPGSVNLVPGTSYTPNSPNKASTATAHFRLQKWTTNQNGTGDSWNGIVPNQNTTYYAQYIQENHNFSYQNNNTNTHRKTCTCGYAIDEGHSYSRSYCICGRKIARKYLISDGNLIVQPNIDVCRWVTFQDKRLDGSSGYSYCHYYHENNYYYMYNNYNGNEQNFTTLRWYNLGLNQYTTLSYSFYGYTNGTAGSGIGKTDWIWLNPNMVGSFPTEVGPGNVSNRQYTGSLNINGNFGNNDGIGFQNFGAWGDAYSKIYYIYLE